MIAVFVPKPRMTLVTAPSKPAMMEPTAMIVPVPMMTPRTVRNERILCSRTVASARPIAEPSSTRVIFPPLAYVRGSEWRSSFHPQRFNRIQLGGTLRRINSEKQADRRGKPHADHHRRNRNSHGNGRKVSHRGGHHPGHHHSDQSARACQHGRFHQELVEDVLAARAHRLAAAGFVRPLG